jgi:UDP-N-acetylglucosamine acyltransferase
MSGIHPTAIIDSSARLADDVEVGPYTVIGPGVEIGSGSRIHSHVVLKGPTRIGKNNEIFQFSSVGEDTPDLKYEGEETWLEIGDHNIIREGVTIHRGTQQDRGATTIGDHNLLMAYAHVAHDCVLGDHVILVNNVALAGHVVIEDWAILGGFTLVHQFCRIGAHCFTGMGTAIGKDLPPFVTAFGSPAVARAINVEGLRRRDFSKEDIQAITRTFKLIYRRGLTVDEACQEAEPIAESSPYVRQMIEALKNSTRGIVR